MFAGPNGSGKSTVLKSKTEIIPKIDLYLNADDIEKGLKSTHELDFGDYSLLVNQEMWEEDCYSGSLFGHLGASFDTGLVEVENNKLKVDGKVNFSAVSTMASQFIRRKLLESRISFSMETVMSHISKVEFLQECRDLGYQVFLLFVTTSDPVINVDRVRARVELEGHDVPKNKIISRYYRTMDNLYPALLACNWARVYDNSGSDAVLLVEVTDQRFSFPESDLPNWVQKYLFDKMISG